MTTYTITGPLSVQTGVPVEYSIILNGVNTTGVDIDVAVTGVSATTSSMPVTIVNGTTTATFTVTYNVGGTAYISATNNTGLTDPTDISVSVVSVVAINPGQTANITKAQAQTLRFITDDEPLGTDKGHAVVTWRRNSGNSGVVDTLDIKGNVVGNYVSISVDVEQIGVSDFILDTTSIPDGNLVTVTVPLDTPSITYS